MSHTVDTLRRITREEYQRMGEQGFFRDERVELLDGLIVEMSPIGPPHVFSTLLLTRALTIAFGHRAWVGIQSSFALSDESMPEPDAFVVPPDDVDATRYPSHALLIVEVAETSLHHDRTVKAALYAEAGVPEYWIVNLIDDVVEVHREPLNGHYSEFHTARHGEILSVAGVSVAVDDILPKR
jgi:Uma2 family endonuclease